MTTLAASTFFQWWPVIAGASSAAAVGLAMWWALFYKVNSLTVGFERIEVYVLNHKHAAAKDGGGVILTGEALSGP